jgi:ABC-type amino acid transport substrate-binding protein
MGSHMVFIKRMISLIFVSLLFTVSLSAKPLIVGLKESPPQIINGADGKATGPTVERMRMVYDKADLEVEIKIYPVKRLRKYMRSGKIDMGLALEASKLPFFARFKVSVSKNPFTIGQTMLYSVSGLPTTSFKDIKGKKLIFVAKQEKIRGDIGEFIYDSENRVLLEKSSTPDTAVKKLFAGRGDYLLIGKGAFEAILKVDPKLKEQAASGMLAFVELEKRPIHIGINKGVDDYEQVIGRVDKAIEQLRAEGKL